MDEEKEVEEFVKIVLNEQKKCYESGCDGCGCAKYGLFNCRYARMAKAAVRKADEVRKETAKEIAEWLMSQDYDFAAEIILEKYGVEVDE